jgi:hypothetical protein
MSRQFPGSACGLPPSTPIRSLSGILPNAPREPAAVMVLASRQGAIGRVTRALGASNGKLAAVLPTTDPDRALMIAGLPTPELDRWLRLSKGRQFLDGLIISIDTRPIEYTRDLVAEGLFAASDQAGLQVIASTADRTPQHGILDRISVDGGLSLDFALRVVHPSGVTAVLDARGPRAVIATIHAVHEMNCFPNRERRRDVLMVKQQRLEDLDLVGKLRSADYDMLELMFITPRSGQLRAFVARLADLPGPSYELYAANCHPSPGQPTTAFAELRMTPRLPRDRLAIEAAVRELGDELRDVDAELHWVVRGNRFRLPNLQAR